MQVAHNKNSKTVSYYYINILLPYYNSLFVVLSLLILFNIKMLLFIIKPQ